MELKYELAELAAYIEGCSKSKYNKSVIDCEGLILSDNMGLGFNIGNAIKYLSRYSNEKGEKARDRKDLLKAAHYIIFEMKRTGERV